MSADILCLLLQAAACGASTAYNALPITNNPDTYDLSDRDAAYLLMSLADS